MADTIIWVGNTSINLAKYSMEFYVMKILSQLILISYKKILVLLYNSPFINNLKIFYLSNIDKKNKDKDDNIN